MALLAVAAATFGSARDWDRAGAVRELEEARALHKSLMEQVSPAPTREQLLRCVRKYQKVYLLDPHYGGSDDAVYAAASLYEQMGERFGDLDHYKHATTLYQFLVSEYPKSRNCPEALLRIGDLFSGPLGDEFLAKTAYEQLRKDYGFSEAARKAAGRKSTEARTQPSGHGRENGGKSGPTSVQGIRYWSTNDYTRVVIDMDREARYEETRLSNPDRIFFDIHTATLNPDLGGKTFVVADEFLKQVRVAQNRLDVVRVVLDFSTVAGFSVFELHNPFRLVIDIRGPRLARAGRKISGSDGGRTRTAAVSQTKPAEASAKASRLATESVQAQEPAQLSDTPPASNAEDSSSALKGRPADTAVRREPAKEIPASGPTLRASTPTSRGDRTLTRMLGLKVGRIVLDPGHGGSDTGTVGPGGMKEKDLVLEVAFHLQRLLEEKLGAEVVLTRETDTFVPLEERTAIANQHQADLFVSIHGNSSQDRSISGVETYYLNFARTADARNVAARENATTLRNVRDLQDLVKKIAQADKFAESREFAGLLQRKLYLGARQVFPSARNRGVRSAPFVVLIGANMPSVLAEVGFLSNPRDERLLLKEGNRQRLAEALFYGIEGYMKTLGSDVAQNQSN